MSHTVGLTLAPYSFELPHVILQSTYRGVARGNFYQKNGSQVSGADSHNERVFCFTIEQGNLQAFIYWELSDSGRKYYKKIEQESKKEDFFLKKTENLRRYSVQINLK